MTGMSKEGARKGRFSLALRTESILAAKTEQEKTSSSKHLRTGNNLSETEGEKLRTTRSQNGKHKMGTRSGDVLDLSCKRRKQTEVIPSKSHNEDYKGISHSEESSEPGTSNSPKGGLLFAKDAQEESELDSLVERLVNLQERLYPHTVDSPDLLLKQKLIEEEHRQREEVFKFIFGDNVQQFASTAEFNQVLQETNMEIDDRLIALRHKAKENEKNIVLYIQHSKHIPGFDTLDMDDILKLLKDSYFEFWLFSNHIYFNEEAGVSGGTGAVVNAHKKVIASLFPKEYVEEVFSFADTLRQLKLTLEEVSIIRVIILTFTDRRELNHPERVESLQQRFVRCLLYHLSTRYLVYRPRFCRILERLVHVRSLTYKNSFVNAQILKDWPFIVKEFPLWKEIMSKPTDYDT